MKGRNRRSCTKSGGDEEEDSASLSERTKSEKCPSNTVWSGVYVMRFSLDEDVRSGSDDVVTPMVSEKTGTAWSSSSLPPPPPLLLLRLLF